MMRQHEGTPLEVVYDSELIAEVRVELDRALDGWKRDQTVRDAAPEMLEALRLIAADKLPTRTDIVHIAEEAIAKATGGANA